MKGEFLMRDFRRNLLQKVRSIDSDKLMYASEVESLIEEAYEQTKKDASEED